MTIADIDLPGDQSGAPFTIHDPTGFGQGALTKGLSNFDPTTVKGWLSAILPFSLIVGGLLLFGLLLMGGFELLTSVGNQEKTQAGFERIKNALVGFLLLFGIYWIAQIAEVLFKVPIL